ncbi:MAG TPA: hypothetical protein VFN56_01490 [Candidatus Saccharimonadales bacterium]|nr:hypothetical protein [Candidatus Saccharimonadales bacterium]
MRLYDLVSPLVVPPALHTIEPISALFTLFGASADILPFFPKLALVDLVAFGPTEKQDDWNIVAHATHTDVSTTETAGLHPREAYNIGRIAVPSSVTTSFIMHIAKQWIEDTDSLLWHAPNLLVNALADDLYADTQAVFSATALVLGNESTT